MTILEFPRGPIHGEQLKAELRAAGIVAEVSFHPDGRVRVVTEANLDPPALATVERLVKAHVLPDTTARAVPEMLADYDTMTQKGKDDTHRLLVQWALSKGADLGIPQTKKKV